MQKKELLSILTNKFPSIALPQSCLAALAETTATLTFPKGATVIKEGQYCNQLFFIGAGGLRAYYLKDGKDITDWFAFETEFVCSIRSYFLNVPSEHYIEAIEPTTALVLSKGSIDQLSEKYRAFERLSLQIVTETMLHLQQRIVSLQFETALQKYQNLIAIRPNITQKVSLTHIASYLGITLETLSRIRKKSRI
ncbi:MAG: Crp/Fnr family transcriptional regulator [Bacteroidota bacterium]